MKTQILILVSLLICSAFTTYNENRIINDEELITLVNESNTTWKAGVNERFADMTLKQVVRLLGSLETPEEEKLPVKEINANKEYPDNFDLREQYPMCQALFEIRDQATCGSCWAFGAASAMSDRICIQSKGTLQTRVSAEFILSCCSSCGMGCNGGYPSSAWKFWKSTGVPTGGLYGDNKTCQPYFFPPCDHHMVGKYGPCSSKEFPTPKCSKTCNNEYPKKLEDDKSYASTAYSLRNSETEIMDDIMAHGSVEIGFDVYEDFMNYKSGIYQHVKGGYLGGHAVKIIGWGVENGVKFWICVNSWNEGWGENGIFRFLKGKNHCGIEAGVVAGLPDLSSSSLKFLK